MQLKVTKGNVGPTPVSIPATTVKVKPVTFGLKAPAPAAPTPTHRTSAPNSNNASANGNVGEEVQWSSTSLILVNILPCVGYSCMRPCARSVATSKWIWLIVSFQLIAIGLSYHLQLYIITNIMYLTNSILFNLFNGILMTSSA
ncbi:hypothetical protein MKX01_041807 [Papaver californicum]|nr:hypothetical protein MKX01_041807 [Papaver californicum]